MFLSMLMAWRRAPENVSNFSEQEDKVEYSPKTQNPWFYLKSECLKQCQVALGSNSLLN